MDNGLIIGGYLGYVGVTETVGDFGGADYGFKYSHIIFGGRVIYPFDFFENGKTQTYVGGMLGYNVVKASFFGDDLFSDVAATSAGSFTYSGFIGLRHPVSQGLMLFCELGYGISYATIGIAKKF